MTNVRRGLALHLHSGIPIIALEGEWNDAIKCLLVETLNGLTRAGHFEIIVNFSLATGVLDGRDWQENLENLAASFHARYGHLSIVGTLEQVEAYMRRKAHSLLRWATSEEQALCQIQGAALAVGGRKVATHLAQF